MALPVLSLRVHQGFGLGSFLVGHVAGGQFAAAILSRAWAGRHADMRGPKHAAIAGLAIASASGLIYLLSLNLVATPSASVGILLLGRVLLGVGESFMITGGQSWALGILTVRNTPRLRSARSSAVLSTRVAALLRLRCRRCRSACDDALRRSPAWRYFDSASRRAS